MTKITNTRCPDMIEKFIEYMNKNPDQRFFQGLTNFVGAGYLGWAATPDGKDFKDLYHAEENQLYYVGSKYDEKSE